MIDCILIYFFAARDNPVKGSRGIVYPVAYTYFQLSPANKYINNTTKTLFPHHNRVDVRRYCFSERVIHGGTVDQQSQNISVACCSLRLS